MYYSARDRESGLGFSLTPPKWLREAAGKIIGSVKLTPPPIDFNLPGGVRVSNQPQPGASLAQQVEQSVPGGWLTIAGVGAVVLLLLTNTMRSRGR